VLDFFKSKRTKRNGSFPGALPVDEGLAFREIRFVVLDTELTGLDRKRDNIVSIGAVKMVGGEIKMGHSFYQLVNPGMPMKAESVVVHEITPSEVLEKPNIGLVLTEFLDFIDQDVLVGHYLNMDLAFINRELKQHLGRTLGNPAVDTLALAYWLRWNAPHQGAEAFTPKKFELYEIAKELGIPIQGAHNALMDAFMTAQVLQRLLPKLAQSGLRALGELLRAGDPARKLQPPGMMI